MSRGHEETSGGFGNPLFAVGDSYESNTQEGLVKKVDYLRQTVDVLSDGYSFRNVQIIPDFIHGSGGMALPRIGDNVLIAKYKGNAYCIKLMPKMHAIPSFADIQKQAEEIKKGNLTNTSILLPPRYMKSEDVANSKEVMANHFVVNSRQEQEEMYRQSLQTEDSKKIYEMDSPVTRRELVQEGDSVIYRGDEGSKIVGLNSGTVAMVGGTFCASAWEKKDNRLKEVIDNYTLFHGCGLTTWETDRESGITNYYSEIWAAPDNADGTKITVGIGKPVKDGLIELTIKNKSNVQHMKRRDKWGEVKDVSGFDLYEANKDEVESDETTEDLKIIIKRDGTVSLLAKEITIGTAKSGITIKDETVTVVGNLSAANKVTFNGLTELNGIIDIKGTAYMPYPTSTIVNDGKELSAGTKSVDIKEVNKTTAKEIK